MRITIAVLILVGLVAAVASSILVGALRADFGRGGVAEVVQPAVQEANVVLASRDLTASEVIDESAVNVVTMPRIEMPKGAITNPAQVIGRVLIQPMLRGQALTEEAFARSGSGFEMATKVLPAGMRAMSIPVSEAAGLEGLLYPGAVVDVMGSFRAAEGAAGGEFVSAVLLQAVQVLAVADRTVVSGAPDAAADERERRGGRRTVTLMVDPRAAETLQLAMAHGASMSLVLRNPLDQDIEPAHGMAMSDLSRIFARLAAEEKPEVIEVEQPAQQERLTREELLAMLEELGLLKELQQAGAKEEDLTTGRLIEILRGTSKETVEFKDDPEGGRPRAVRR